MSRWKRIYCLFGRHAAQQSVEFIPGAGVNFTVTSARARCRRCGTMVTLVSESATSSGCT